MNIIADRSFAKRTAKNLILFFKTLGGNISTKSLFLAFKTLGDDLLAENLLMEDAEKAVQAKDFRELGSRKTSRRKAIKIALQICDEVNAIADNDPAVYDEAGLDYVEVADPNRPIGDTKVLNVKYNLETGRMDIRVKKADRANGYRLDLKTSAGVVMTEHASISGTKGSFLPPSTLGTYRCRATPVDSKGSIGTPSIWSDDFGVY